MLDDLTTWDYISGIGAILCVPVVIFLAGLGVGWLIWA